MPNKYIPPRSDFQWTKRFVEEHGRLIEQPAFKRAIEVAKAEYTHKLCELDSVEPHTSMMRMQRLIGVEQFVSTLYNLAESPTLPPKMGDPDNLSVTGSKPRRP
jgi:hypothetical protein